MILYIYIYILIYFLLCRLQCFLINSIKSSNKDMVSIVPVTNLTCNNLFDMTERVVQNLTKAGFIIQSIISDNNIVNRKMFMKLCGGDLHPYYINIINNTKIFLLFDNVHIIKSIRNNWLNLKNIDKTFTYPNFNDENCTEICYAKFNDLEKLYNYELSSIVKKAPSLTYKSLHPHSLERQSVSLALKIFDEKTITGLKMFMPVSNTHEFMKIINTYWNIVNVKTIFKGEHKRDDYQ